jgi:hypothetical protein
MQSRGSRGGGSPTDVRPEDFECFCELKTFSCLFLLRRNDKTLFENVVAIKSCDTIARKQGEIDFFSCQPTHLPACVI